jgi:hypothetical protein
MTNEIMVMSSDDRVARMFESASLTIEGGAGHTKLTWDPDKSDQVADAKKAFDTLKKQGFTFFTVGRGRSGGERITKFDESLGKVRVEAGEGKKRLGGRKAVAVPKMAGG